MKNVSSKLTFYNIDVNIVGYSREVGVVPQHVQEQLRERGAVVLRARAAARRHAARQDARRRAACNATPPLFIHLHSIA